MRSFQKFRTRGTRYPKSRASGIDTHRHSFERVRFSRNFQGLVRNINEPKGTNYNFKDSSVDRNNWLERETTYWMNEEDGNEALTLMRMMQHDPNEYEINLILRSIKSWVRVNLYD